jgi:branched-chain amino acid transport system permease protein
MVFLQQLINGIGLGGTYALVSVGYALVFGVLNVLNLAHGEIFMLGSYVGLLTYYFNPSPLLAIGAGFISAGIAGMIMERLAIRPVIKEHLAPLLTTIGVSVILQNSVRVIWGPVQKPYPFEFKKITWGTLTFPSIVFINLVVSFIIMIVLLLFIQKTKMGRAIRSVAENPDFSGALGVNIGRIMMLTVGLASALGGLAGVLMGMTLGSISPFMGVNFGLKGIIILIVGGVGNLYGAMVFGVLLGIIEIFSVTFLSAPYRDIIAVTFLIVILIFRPQGLFGELGRGKEG